MPLTTEKEVYDPANLPPTVVVWETTGRPGQSPGHDLAAKLLVHTVDHVRVAGEHAQDHLVPAAIQRLAVLLEDAGLSPASIVKAVPSFERELRILAAEINADVRKTLHRRMAVELATTLIPRLTGGATQ